MRLSKCPICGHTPIIDKESLDRGNGHGYPGHYKYDIKCSNKECPLSREVPMFSCDDIYRRCDEVNEYLCEIWNMEAYKINLLIMRRNN